MLVSITWSGDRAVRATESQPESAEAPEQKRRSTGSDQGAQEALDTYDTYILLDTVDVRQSGELKAIRYLKAFGKILLVL